MGGEKDVNLLDLYEIMMQREVDPRFEADRFVDLSERELRELMEDASVDEEEIDLNEIEAFKRNFRK